LGQLNENWKEFGFEKFGGTVQRRGTDVSTLEIGSRGEVLCFWGNVGFCAVLRREWVGGFGKLEIFGILGGDPREAVEEGDTYVSFVCLGEFKLGNYLVWEDLGLGWPAYAVLCGCSYTVRGIMGFGAQGPTSSVATYSCLPTYIAG
jgi:hypothetical protein